MCDGIDRGDSREADFSGGLCLHFQGGGMRPGPWGHHLLGCKTGDTSFIPPQRDFFLRYKMKAQVFAFTFPKNLSEGDGKQLSPFS